MRLKLYRAPAMAEAMARVRAELGEDALILATRRVGDGVEVTAALEPDDLPLAKLSDADRDRLGAYVAHFNARDFDAIRAMIADDVRLELVSKTRMNGKAEVSRYFGNYEKAGDWRLVVGLVEGHPAILVFDPNEPGAEPKYFMLLQWAAGEVASIRDFRHAPYVIDGAEYRI